MVRVFISYSHQQGTWVWDRLVPVLMAAGADVLIDRERFRAGRSLVGQMDALQDQAERHLLVLSEDYLASDYCCHEMERAIAANPDFSKGVVLPLLRQACVLPPNLSATLPLTGPDPMWLRLEDDTNQQPWSMLLKACKARLRADAPHWLTVRDQVARFLNRGQSVNLVVSRKAQWRPLLQHLRTEHLPKLAVVNLEKGSTARRRGLIVEILRSLGHRVDPPDEPDDLAELDRLICAGPPAMICLVHFDQVAFRPHYGADLFAALRYLMMEKRKLVLLVESRTPFAALLPRDHPLSSIDIRTVAFRAFWSPWEASFAPPQSAGWSAPDCFPYRADSQSSAVECPLLADSRRKNYPGIDSNGELIRQGKPGLFCEDLVE